MEKMYKITAGQAYALTKPEKHNGAYFNPVQDKNGQWFIGDAEYRFILLHFGFIPVEAVYVAPEIIVP